MDAKRAPTAFAAVTAADDGGPQERSWLVFRLGPHTMCASTLDVEGIIEPKPTTLLPFTPAYVLGSFMFRGEVATAISLRRKLAVPVGQDSAQGPFVVARVGDELAAFWVDEVTEVMGEQDAAWQPMPDMLRSRVFDCYTIVRDELILHTSFAALLEADAESLPARWRGIPEEPVMGKEPGMTQVTDARDASGETHSAPAQAIEEPPPTELRSAEPGGATDRDATAPEGRSDTPTDRGRTPFVRRSAAQPLPKDRQAFSARLGAMPSAASATSRPRPVPENETTRRASSAKPGSTGARRAQDSDDRSSAATGIPGNRDTHQSRRAPPMERQFASADNSRAVHAEAVPESRASEHAIWHATASASSDRASAAKSRAPRARALAGAALALGAVLIAIFALWPDEGTNSPAATESAENRARGPIIAESTLRPQAAPAVVRAAPAEPDPAPEAPATPSPATRVAAVESETLSITIERPTKTPRAQAKPAAASAAAPSPGQPATAVDIVHVVVRGDTLWDISRKYLHNPFRYPELVRLSGIRNPNLIHPGDIVRIRINQKRR